GHRQIAFILL
ncbi:5'/3'-nucleotidase SurE, partial [Vibrio parahaemolyticus V-223/04]